MVGKLCKAPSSGGSARGAVRYILGYELGAKNEQTREAYYALLAEAQTRPDGGVGVVWVPGAGGGIRPAAVYAEGVTSLATADLEMEAVARANRRVKTPVDHYVFSWDAADNPSVEDAIGATLSVLEKMGYGAHQKVLAVHDDTDNRHVHVTVNRVDPFTLKVHETLHNYPIMHRALRETELAFDMRHDHGLYVVEPGTDRVIKASPQEIAAWKRERSEHRLEAAARKALGDYRDFEDVETWAKDKIALDVGRELRAMQERGERMRAGDLHLVAASDFARLDLSPDGRIRVTRMERLEEDERERIKAELIAQNVELKKLDSFGEPLPVHVPRWRTCETTEIAIEDVAGYSSIGDQRFAQEAEIIEERARLERVAFLKTLSSVEDAEVDFARQIREDVTLISRELIASGRATFTEEDITNFIAARITDGDEISALASHIVRHDDGLIVLSADLESPLFTTKRQHEMETMLADRATQLATIQDETFDANALQRSIVQLESEKGVVLSDEQRELLLGVQHRMVWVNGDAGTGKTTAMRGLQIYGEETGHRVVGLSLTEKATRELAAAGEIESMNIARALTLEEHGYSVFRRGDLVIVDETSMANVAQMNELFRLALERDFSLLGIGDGAQLRALSAGATHDVVFDVAKDCGVDVHLTEVRRQTGDLEWMSGKDGHVSTMGDAIRTRDREGVEAGVKRLADHGILESCQDRTDAIRGTVDEYLKAIEEKKTALMLAGDRFTCKHVNDEVINQFEASGRRERLPAQSFHTADNGVRNLAVGDRFVFLKIDRKSIGVNNGDVGTVERVAYDERRDRWNVAVRLDDGRDVVFDPRQYRHWNHGWALTVIKAQGSTVDRVYLVADKTINPELLHTATTRAREGIKVRYSGANFPEGHKEFAQHVADRVRPLDDALLFDQIVQSRGGPDSQWAVRARKALVDANDPLRRMHRDEMMRREQQRARAAIPVHEKYRREAAGLPENAGDRRRALVEAQRDEIKRIGQLAPPIGFRAWLAQNQELVERIGQNEQLRDRERQRVYDRERERMAERENLKEQQRTHVRPEKQERERLETRAIEEELDMDGPEL